MRSRNLKKRACGPPSSASWPITRKPVLGRFGRWLHHWYGRCDGWARLHFVYFLGWQHPHKRCMKKQVVQFLFMFFVCVVFCRVFFWWRVSKGFGVTRTRLTEGAAKAGYCSIGLEPNETISGLPEPTLPHVVQALPALGSNELHTAPRERGGRGLARCDSGLSELHDGGSGGHAVDEIQYAA